MLSHETIVKIGVATAVAAILIGQLYEWLGGERMRDLLREEFREDVGYDDGGILMKRYVSTWRIRAAFKRHGLHEKHPALWRMQRSIILLSGLALLALIALLWASDQPL